MATSIWKKISDVSGFTNVGQLLRAIRQGDWFTAGNLSFLPGALNQYVDNIKSWDSDSTVNSAVTESSNSNGIKVNPDGSINASDMTSVDQLGTIGLEALLGGIPEYQRLWSTAENQKARDWETEMSNTAYQRAVADMNKAGINPILAYSQGGANVTSSPITSGASSASSLGSSLDGVTKLIKTVMKEDRKDDVQAAQLVEKYSPSNSARTMHVKLRK